MMAKIFWFIRKHLWIILIVIFALGIRLLGTMSLPPSLNWDEVSHGYNAYSILKTGKDEWGVAFPTIFRAYGDYKLPVYIYLTAISESLLGLTALAVRLPSILAGTASVLFTFLLVKRLLNNRKIAYLAALLMAIEPWSFFVSRIALEANLALFFVIAGTYFFVDWTAKKNWEIILSVLFFGLSVWTYNSARIFTPLFLVSLVLIYWSEVAGWVKGKRKYLAVTALLGLIFFVPMFYQLVNPSGQARYNWVQILDEGALAKIIEQRSSLKLPGIFPRLLSNKVTYFIREFVSNYFSHFSPEFLFWQGGSHYQFSVPGHGLLYLVDLPFFLLGIIVLIKNFKEKHHQVILVWLLLGPVASSLTREAPHALRALLMLPMPMILTAVGVFSLSLILKKESWQKLLVVVYAVVIAASVENYAGRSLEYAKKYSWAWQFGYQEMVSFVKEKYTNYDNIIITKKYGEPHEFVLFFWPWDPAKYRQDPDLIRFYQSDWYWVDRFDKFYFVNDWQMPQKGFEFVLESKGRVDCRDRRCLVVTGPDNYPSGWRKIDSIKFLDGSEAFGIYENGI